VAGAILRRGGRAIQTESEAWVKQHGPAGHEKPALTRGGQLPARWVIHAVGPVWGSGDEERKLRAAYSSALLLAHEKRCTSIAFPSISTGIFGFPVERGAALGIQAAIDFCSTHPDSPLRHIRFTLIDLPTVEVFRAEFARRFGT
jgi:O-acetyl-ADP-ribose deacetylase (regulator of RNase III)